ncbi:hypothetical protein ABB30_11120 [Stenotrophomonas ginsengisoli]|uniref:DNA (cytosine-5-)-methyltransferase n=1 Tax=Stenotrophomonas ginsengisoli TaxID=336566 RepID=A0A0R0DBY9_9GAMM|nr:DNA cytosine methyltransferase [Stenotrophomonas ginsengisoli]KRG75786.1 hypothetical protein ABB30_11120 [Stenotrophomonas ginsengisoli]
MSIKVVDIFAGAGGLGEGFSAFRNEQGEQPFKVVLSAEMDAHAAKTLRTRAFFHQFPLGQAPDSYYAYVRGEVLQPWTEETREQWEAACSEAHQLTLGEDDVRLDQLLNEKIGTNATTPWVLVGGPPCQAFSLAGRSRNVGIKDYDPAKDHRHFLYRHYLHIVSKYQPAVFILENVKGMLSSRVDGKRMFPRIIADLKQPGGPDGPKYRVVPVVRHSGFEPEERDFLLRAEELGLPQARHRVVLMGIKEDIALPEDALLQPGKADEVTVAQALNGLPKLRSRPTDHQVRTWSETASLIFSKVAKKAKKLAPAVSGKLLAEAEKLKFSSFDPGLGGNYVSDAATRWSNECSLPDDLYTWLVDPAIAGTLNHCTRGHMTADLERYAYASAYAHVTERAPRGPAEFPESLAPVHKNWAEGKKFVDRFNVQCMDGPSSTITSHLAKDGHYFIHPDFTQIRSLSVREAARLQTFPDNFFFEGPAGAQRKQVGNAVPPYLARQIASVVFAAINGTASDKEAPAS